LEDLSVDEGIILKWILKEWNLIVWVAFIYLRIGINGGAPVNMVMNTGIL
jgi:hypothetical protein